MRSSDSIVKIAPDLVAALSEFKNPAKTATNPHFHSKYAPLHETLDMARPILSQHNIAVIQSGVVVDGVPGTVTRLIHSSGEWIESDPTCAKPQNDTPQGWCGSVTYTRRYSLEALLFICGDEDDDGNAASAKPNTRPASAPTQRQATAARSISKPATKPAPSSGGGGGGEGEIWIVENTDSHVTFDGVTCLTRTKSGTGLKLGYASDDKNELPWLNITKRSGAPTGLVCELDWKEVGQVKIPKWMFAEGDLYPFSEILARYEQEGPTIDDDDQSHIESISNDDIPF